MPKRCRLRREVSNFSIAALLMTAGGVLVSIAGAISDATWKPVTLYGGVTAFSIGFLVAVHRCSSRCCTEACAQPRSMETEFGHTGLVFNAQHRTPDVRAVKRLVPRLRGDARRPFRVTVFDRRQLADGTIGVSLPYFPGRTRSALQSTE